MSSVSDYGSRRLMIRCASRPHDSTTQPVYMVGLYCNCSMAKVMKILYFFYYKACHVGINWIFTRSVVVQIYTPKNN